MTSQWVGVTHANFHLHSDHMLRRALLLFDKIAVVDLNWRLKELPLSLVARPNLLSSIEYLIEKGLIIDHNLDDHSKNSDINMLISSGHDFQTAEHHEVAYQETSTFTPEGWKQSYDMRCSYQHNGCVFLSRAAASQLRSNNFDATPIIHHDSLSFKLPQNHNTQAIQVCIDHVPMVIETVPLKEIVQFKLESETKDKIIQLRRWLRKISDSNISQSELTDEIEWLLNDYQKYMTLHKMKYSLGTLESACVLAAEVFEDILTLRLKSLTERLFRISKQNYELTESELTAPGREVSIFLHAADKLEG